MALQVSVVVGNPNPRSRTLTVAETLVARLFAGGSYELDVIDLVDVAGAIFDWKDEAVSALNDRVAASDVAVFASPTYKATYTGLLKAFLDRYPSNGLAGVVAIPLLTGADRSHSMGPNVNLAPLLVELGAIVPGRGIYFVTGEMDHLDEQMELAAGECAANLASLASVAASMAR